MFKNEFSFEDLPSTSQSTPNRSHKESALTDTDNNSTRLMLSSMSMIDVQEQHTRSIVEDISRRVQDLIEKINNRRASDQKVIDSFQEKLVDKVTEICQQMKESMYTVYEKNSNEMQVKLQELSVVLESCSKLSSELVEVTQVLTGVREGLDISKMSES